MRCVRSEREKQLRDRGFRITVVRSAIWDCFEENQYPLSVEELMDLLRKRGISCDLATVYRQLETLERCGIIERLDVPGSIRRYEITTEHHHHFVCRECQKTQCMDACVTRSITHIERLARRNGWQVEAHSFSLSGLCRECGIKEVS